MDHRGSPRQTVFLNQLWLGESLALGKPSFCCLNITTEVWEKPEIKAFSALRSEYLEHSRCSVNGSSFSWFLPFFLPITTGHPRAAQLLGNYDVYVTERETERE